jgi:hypothetical protein
MTDLLADSLAAGLRWLYDTEQPDGALLRTGGPILRTDDNRTLGFAPVSALLRPVVILDVTKVEWIDRGPYDLKEPANPLAPGELEALAERIVALGFDISGTWNGHPGITGSVGLKRPAHPSLLAAVELYRAGCPEHPQRSVFCDCGWYAAGHALITQPPAAAVPSTTA